MRFLCDAAAGGATRKSRILRRRKDAGKERLYQGQVRGMGAWCEKRMSVQVRVGAGVDAADRHKEAGDGNLVRRESARLSGRLLFDLVV